MTRVVGLFQVWLSSPFAPVYHEIGPVQLRIGGWDVEVVPSLEEPDIIDYEADGYPIRAWHGFIVKRLEVRVAKDLDTQEIDHAQHERYLDVVKEVVRRIVVAVKKNCDDPFLDIRKCIASYTVQYVNQEDSKLMFEPKFSIYLSPWEPSEPLTAKKWEIIETEIQGKIDISPHEELLFEAKKFFEEERFELALLHAAISMELVLTRWLRKELKRRGNTTESQIDKFLDETSKRLLTTVVLPLMSNIQAATAVKYRRVFENRNGLVHGKKHRVSRDEAVEAVEAAADALSAFGTV